MAIKTEWIQYKRDSNNYEGSKEQKVDQEQTP